MGERTLCRRLSCRLNLLFVPSVFAQPAEPVRVRDDLLWSQLKLKRNLGVGPYWTGVKIVDAVCSCEFELNVRSPSDRQIVFSAGRTFTVQYMTTNDHDYMQSGSLQEQHPPSGSNGYKLNSIRCRLKADSSQICTTAQIKSALSEYFEVTHYTFPNAEASVVDEGVNQGLVFDGEIPESVAHGI